MPVLVADPIDPIKTKKKKIKQSPADILFYIIILFILLLSSLLVIYPLVYILSASLSAPSAVLTGRVWLLPVDFSLFSFSAVFKNKLIISGYFNSTLYAVSGMFVSTVLTLMTAYPLSCKNFYGKKIFTWIFLFTMLFSGGLIPTYILLRDLGMTGSRLSIILPNAIAIWLVIITRSFFEQSIPDELHEAAEIDGCSDLRYFLSILIPLSAPIIAVVALNYAVYQWNGYYDALIYLSDQKKYPLQIILRDILILNRVDMNTMTDVESAMRKQGLAIALKYALIVVASAPLLIVYPFLQKYFVKGVMVGSVKG